MKPRNRARLMVLALLLLVCLPFGAIAEATAATLCGVPVPAGATVIDFGETKVRIATLAEELASFPQLTKVDMYESRVNKEQMAMLTERYPAVRFGWTLRFGKWRLRTDATAFSTHNSTHSKAYTSQVFEVLQYCHDLRALDLGHNMVNDISFLTELTQLKILILADNSVKDISPLAQLKELEYVEMFRNHLTDISPLAQLPKLRDLNLCRNFGIKDASALFACKTLERGWLSYCGISDAQQAELRAAFPEAEFNFTVFSSTYGGWREHPRYFDVVEMFRTRVYQPWTGEAKT
jgi:hypothetical protein